MKSILDKKSNKENIRINSRQIYLRILNESDATEEYASWINDLDVNKYLETKKTTVEELQKYISDKKESNDCLFFGIFLNENNKHIGNIKLEPISLKNKNATMGMMIGDKNYWGRGIATEALNVLVDWAFENLDLYEIDLGVQKDNVAAIKVYEKSGFQIYKIKETSFFMVKRKIRLALGTVQLGVDYGVNNHNGKPKREEAMKILRTAYENGVRVFDTASGYGDAEEILGEFISAEHLEDKISVITKINYIEPTTITHKKNENDIQNDIQNQILLLIEKSLEKLKLKQLDGILLHNVKQMYDWRIVNALKLIKEKGIVRNIGVSVYEEKDALYAAQSEYFDYIQIPYNLLNHHIDETDFFQNVQKNRITIIARSPFLQGLFLMEPENIPPYLEKVKPYLNEFDNTIKKYLLTRQEAALLFSYSNKMINYVLFGVDNLEQLEQNIMIIKNKKMNKECLSELKKLFNDVDDTITNPSKWRSN